MQGEKKKCIGTMSLIKEDVRIEGSGSKGEVDWTHEISCVKIGGKWYIHRPGFD